MRPFKDNLPRHVECEFLFNVDVAIKENVKILTFRQDAQIGIFRHVIT
jgi:hypothetical protein